MNTTAEVLLWGTKVGTLRQELNKPFHTIRPINGSGNTK